MRTDQLVHYPFSTLLMMAFNEPLAVVICDAGSEYYDLSRQEPQLLASMLSRLKAYRATAVDANLKTNPDHGCPTVRHRSS